MRIFESNSLKKLIKILLFSCFLFSTTIVKAGPNKHTNTTISLNLTDTRLEEVLATIESQTDFNFFYKNSTINLNRLVTIKVTDESIGVVLTKIFNTKKLIYKIRNHQVILKTAIKIRLHTIQGKIIDKKTGEAIPFCSVQTNDLLVGTSSNEIGEFEIKVDSIPVKLIFNHLSYEKQIVTITNKKEIATIELTPLVYELEEVALSNKKDFYAYELAKKAFRRADVNAKNKKYGKAYYRQKSKNGKDYSEFSEIIYDIQYSTEGIKEWDILEGRYAIKGGTVNNRNYTLLSRILKSFQQNSEDLIFPFRDNIDHFYNVKLTDRITSKDTKIAVLSFEPYSKVKSPILEAEAYIDIETNELLKLTATLKNDDFKAVKFKEKNAYKRKYILSYEMAFKKGNDSTLVMDYMKVDQEFDYYKNDSLKTHVTSTSSLSFFEHYIPSSRKKLGRQFYDKESDWQKLNAIKYNERFWKENPVVKRTPIEQEIIQSFERKNAFESIFLNSRQQISLTQSNIDDDVFIQQLEKNTQDYNSYSPVEKIYLHTDKELFTNREDLWFSAYVTLGTKHHYSLASKVLYVDLINPDGKTVESQTLPLEQGRGKGNITIPKKLASGEYQLRAYTNWMRNYDDAFFFTKTIKIINNIAPNILIIDNTIDLQFFPEGGNAIAGLNGRIAFKAIGKDGLGKDVKGKIVDSNNNFILNFKSKDQGAGVFNLKPKLNESYTAIINENLKISLPKIANTGYTMFVNNIDTKNIKIKIQATENLRGKKFYVTGHMHNEKYYQGKFEFGGKLLVNFEIPKNKLPSGVFTLTVFNEEGIPVSERAIFINSENELNITANINQAKLLPNNKIAVEIQVKDSRNWPVSTDLSIAITDLKKYKKDNLDANILTQIYLQSDVKGHIENPALFLNTKKRTIRYRLELLMLTHGWRRIDWTKIKNEAANTPKKYDFEQGIRISGVAKKNGKLLQNQKLKMIAMSNNQMATYLSQTDDKGKFIINNFNTIGETKVNFNIVTIKGKTTEIDVVLDLNTPMAKLPSSFKKFQFNKLTAKEKEYVKFTSLNIVNDSLNRLLVTNKEVTLLNEVEIDGIKRTKKDITNYDRDNMSGYNMVADHTIYPKNISGENMLDVLADVPGLQYIQNRIHIRRNPKPALWLMDGVEILELPYNLEFGNIEKIEILKSLVSTAIYGPRGANGVIIFKTKTARSSSLNAANFKPNLSIIGHTESRDFYIPKYTSTAAKKPYKDSRATLYWNPMIRTDKDGKATVIFNNSDAAKQIQIVIEGLSKYGEPGVLIKTF